MSWLQVAAIIAAIVAGNAYIAWTVGQNTNAIKSDRFAAFLAAGGRTICRVEPDNGAAIAGLNGITGNVDTIGDAIELKVTCDRE